MNLEAKQKVLEALRSGRYKQGKGQLRENNCFCVWGVICDVSGVGKWTYKEELGDWYKVDNRVSQSLPPSEVREWLGGDPKVTIYGVHESIMWHNDQGITFAELADAIEEQL